MSVDLGSYADRVMLYDGVLVLRFSDHRRRPVFRRYERVG